MKTNTFLLLCFFLGIGLTQVSAQKKELNDRGTCTLIERGIWNGYTTPVFCDGVQVDFLVGTAIEYQLLFFFKDGIIYKASETFKGEIKSTKPPYETFRLSEFDKMDGTTGYFKFNLLGNMGTHYIQYVLLDTDFHSVRAVCLEND
jgi:hypothetical protein